MFTELVNYLSLWKSGYTEKVNFVTEGKDRAINNHFEGFKTATCLNIKQAERISIKTNNSFCLPDHDMKNLQDRGIEHRIAGIWPRIYDKDPCHKWGSSILLLWDTFYWLHIFLLHLKLRIFATNFSWHEALICILILSRNDATQSSVSPGREYCREGGWQCHSCQVCLVQYCPLFWFCLKDSQILRQDTD